MRNPFQLKDEAEKECYILIDQYYKKLIKNPDGSISQIDNEFNDNDND